MKPIGKPWRTSNLIAFITTDLKDLTPIRITILKCNTDPQLKALICSYREKLLLDKDYLIDSSGLIIEMTTDINEGFYCIQGFINKERSFNKQYYIPFNSKNLVIGYKYSIYEPLKI